MLNGFFNVWSAGAFLISCLALYLSVRNAARVRELSRRQPDLRASRLQSIETSLEELSETVRELANRVKMMRVRTAINHTSDKRGGLPDPYQDPDAWRREANKSLGLRTAKGASS